MKLNPLKFHLLLAVALTLGLVGPTTASATYYGGWSGYHNWSYDHDTKDHDKDRDKDRDKDYDKKNKDKDKDVHWPKKKWPKSDWEDDDGKKKCKYHKGCYKHTCKPPKDVPEPATALGLISLGLVGLVSGFRRIRR